MAAWRKEEVDAARHETDRDLHSAYACRCVTRCPSDHPFLCSLCCTRSLCFIFILFPTYEQRGGGGGGLPDFLCFVIFSLFSRPRAGLATV